MVLVNIAGYDKYYREEVFKMAREVERACHHVALEVKGESGL